MGQLVNRRFEILQMKERGGDSSLNRWNKHIPSDLDLLASSQVFQGKDASAEFVFSGDQCETGAEFARGLQ